MDGCVWAQTCDEVMGVFRTSPKHVPLATRNKLTCIFTLNGFPKTLDYLRLVITMDYYPKLVNNKNQNRKRHIISHSLFNLFDLHSFMLISMSTVLVDNKLVGGCRTALTATGTHYSNGHSLQQRALTTATGTHYSSVQSGGFLWELNRFVNGSNQDI